MENFPALRQFIIDTLGHYELVYDANENLVGGIAGLNFEWLFTAFLFGAAFIGSILIGRTLIRALFG